MIRIITTLVGIALVIAGGRWMVIGANIWTGNAMSGQQQWLLVGLACVIAGIAVAAWGNLRRKPA